jgi:WASH complex subunit strumpellin
MREIVDKHFGDNWIVNVYLGHIADLTFWWDSYKAAKTALKNCVDKAVVSALTQRFFEKLVSQTETTKKVLAEGVLTQELLLEQTSKLFNVVRENNITLRWLLLQWFCVDKKLKAIVCKDVNEEMIVTFLLNVSQLEFHMRNILTDLIQKRQSIWEACKKESMERMQELSEYFSGQKPLVRAKQDDSLKQWFLDLKSQIDNLNFSSPTAAARKIVNIVNALENVEEFHKIESSLQVKQFLGDSRSYLQRMIRVVNIKENDLAILNIISDFSFAWNLIQADRFVQVFHDKIKNQPRICLLLRATFLKLVSIMDMPLVRINQCGSRDVVSVAAFYSSELLSFIRKVLEIVPQSMFTSLNSIISIQTSGFKELPLKIQKAEMIEYAQLDSRFELARCTRQISLFTEGILAMETTFVGIIEMEPRDVLEQGIRKELVLQVAKSLNDQIKYKTTKVEEFEDVLRKLGIQFSGFRRSFEYIQDYIQLHGLKVWQEEFGRVLNFNLEQECNLFLKKKILPSESIYQSIAVPIPAFASEPGENCGFIGRLVRELCRHTDPFKNIFVRARQGWFGMDKKETVGIKTFSLLMQALGVQGLSGIDRLISFMIARDLGRCFRLIKTVSTQEVKDLIAELVKEAFPFGKFSVALTKLYQKCWLVFDKISVKKELLEALSNVGQKQLLRIQIANELSFAAKIDSKSLSLCLESLNRSLISDILLSSHKFETQCDLIPELSNFFELSGLTNPVMKLYISENAPCDSFGVFVFLFVMTMVPNLFWLKKADLGHKSRKEKVDGAVFCLGIASLLKQTHPANTLTFISLVGQYVSALTRLSLFK